MITDIFARRYATALHYYDIHAERLAPFFMQAAHVYSDINDALAPPDTFYKAIHDRLARELGLPALSFERVSHGQICSLYLGRPYDLWNDAHGSADHFLKTRFSMLELLLRGADDYVREKEARPALGLVRGRFNWRTGKPKDEDVAPAKTDQRAALDAAINEINHRLREHRTDLIYHNGMLHLADDGHTADRVETPFWEVVADPKWHVVDREMKEACERLDRSQADAPIYALRALESTIKVISDDRGWSTGREKGAVNYIENLQSERSGRFIAAWEADALRALFRDIRNPHSHGGGASQPDPLSDHQRMWVVESAMSWIKSLVRRR